MNSTASLRRSALIAGIALLIMAVAAPYAEYVRTHDAISQLSLAVAAYACVAVLDVIVALALYSFFKHAGTGLSAFAAVLRIVYAAIFGVAIFYLATGSASAFSMVWNAALLFFGLHLALLGFLAWRSLYVPKWISVLVAIAGLGYLTDSIGKMLVPHYSISVTMVTFIGEVLLMLWLLIKGWRIAPVAQSD